MSVEDEKMQPNNPTTDSHEESQQSVNSETTTEENSELSPTNENVAPVEESSAEKTVEVVAPEGVEAPVDETPKEEEPQVAAAPAEEAVGEHLPADHNWYVVRTYSGYEQKAKLALMERIKQHNMEKDFSKVLIPSESVIELVRGQKKTTSRKFFPGYMLVRMNLTDHTWHVLKNTPKVTGFVGDATKPPAVPEEEVAKITTQMQEGSLKPRPKVSFEEGENVRVVDGPFNNFNGLVEHVNEEKGKLRVLVSIFGRSTPVELDFVQVEKN